MEKRINIVWKVLFIVVLIALSLIPIYFMQQYARSVIDEQSGLIQLATQSANYLSGLVDSIQGQTSAKESLNLQANYLFTENILISSPLTLGLAFLLLLLIDIIKSSKLSLANYLIAGIGLVLFYLIELVFAGYIEYSFAYFVPAVIISLLLASYLSGAIKSIVCGIVYGIGLLIIYTLAFYLVSQVDNLLMYGAICLVIIFVVIILTTRKIDWNQPTERVKGGAKKLN